MHRQNLDTALKADGLDGAATYMKHARDHRKAILSNIDRVRAKADGTWPRPLSADQVAGAKRRLAEYEATLEQYAADEALWEPVRNVLEAAGETEEEVTHGG